VAVCCSVNVAPLMIQTLSNTLIQGLKLGNPENIVSWSLRIANTLPS
jgi:hypothetical protein